MKKHIVSIDFNYFLAESPDQAIALLDLKCLSRDYVSGKHIYTPKGRVEKTVIVIDEEDIREVTKEEKENKELESAKTQAQWAKKENADLKKQVEELKCQLAGIKALKEESETVEPT